MAKWKITFENGYCGCDVEEKFEGTEEDARNWADEYLPEYAENYAYVAFGWAEDPNPEEYEDYTCNCCYTIEKNEEEI
ncbi:MAG: hypothetical protein IJZ62_04165 [Clostridia bacterium]|nr:hypothetical protein [Clostridia bacterium]